MEVRDLFFLLSAPAAPDAAGAPLEDDVGGLLSSVEMPIPSIPFRMASAPPDMLVGCESFVVLERSGDGLFV